MPDPSRESTATEIPDWFLVRRIAVIDVASEAWAEARSATLNRPRGSTSAICLLQLSSAAVVDCRVDCMDVLNTGGPVRPVRPWSRPDSALVSGSVTLRPCDAERDHRSRSSPPGAS